MKTSLIPVTNLFLSFIPSLFVLFIFIRWDLNWKGLIWASFRMLSQLFLIGYVLNYIFNSDTPLWTVLVISIMIFASAWISLYSIKEKRMKFLKYAIAALFCGAVPTLLFFALLIIPHTPWYDPAFLIPISGMVLSHSMNTIGLAAERFESELQNHAYHEARKNALKAALIPLMNTFMAVGLVSLPGLMTGQILAGVNPLIAARYQIIIMTLVLGAGGSSVICYLYYRQYALSKDLKA
jgi:putative ABC transport system permease protein